MSKKPSKRYRAALQVADLKAKYDVAQAAEIIKKMPGAKFDETVEISAFLGVDQFSLEFLPTKLCTLVLDKLIEERLRQVRDRKSVV